MVKSGHVLGFLLCEGVINSLDGGAERGGRNKCNIFQVASEHRIQQGASERPEGTLWTSTTVTNHIDGKKCAFAAQNLQAFANPGRFVYRPPEEAGNIPGTPRAKSLLTEPKQPLKPPCSRDRSGDTEQHRDRHQAAGLQWGQQEQGETEAWGPQLPGRGGTSQLHKLTRGREKM